MSQLMNIISNEPSLGLYRIQEHIRKSIPKLENQTKKLEDCSTVMKDLNYTMENAQHSIISGFVLKTPISTISRLGVLTLGSFRRDLKLKIRTNR